MNNHTRHSNAILIFLAITVIWGATFTLTKKALDLVDPYSFLAVRFVIAAIFLIGISIIIPTTRHHFHRKTWLLGSGLGVCLFFAYILQTIGLEYTTPAKAGFLTGFAVVLVPLMGPFIVKRPIRLHMAVSALLAICGLLLLCGVNLSHFAFGDFLVLLCSVFIALQMLFIEKWGQQMDSLAVSTIEIGVLSGLSVLAADILPHPQVPMNVWWSPSVSIAILVCAIPATAFAYYAQTIYQKQITSAQAAVIFSMEPVFAAIISVIFLGEVLDLLQWLGSIFIFISMLTADESLMQRRRWNWLNLFTRR